MSKFQSFLFASLLGFIPALGAVIVNNQSDLETAINGLSTATSDVTITFGQSIPLTSQLSIINMPSGHTVTIDGSNYNLDGGNLYRGFFAYSGNVVIKDMTIQNTKAKGGDGGGGGGGGGAGLGGGLFVNNGATVTIESVNFNNNNATGGNGTTSTSSSTNGGGGGMGGRVEVG